MKLFSLISAGAVLCLAAGSWQLCGQTTDVSATVQFSNGQTLPIINLSDLIGVQSNEIVNVTVQFPVDSAGRPANVALLDGGRLIDIPSAVTQDGSVTFRYQATPNAGQNRIIVHGGAEKLCLQFWVLDSANPQNNPPVITPANPEG